MDKKFPLLIMNKGIQIIELIKFEPVTLAHGNENLFVLFEIISHYDRVW